MYVFYKKFLFWIWTFRNGCDILNIKIVDFISEEYSVMIFNDGDMILFTGDSVTDAGRSKPRGEGIGDGVGHGYVRAIDSLFSAFYPKMHIRMRNSGIGGYTSSDLLAQWEENMALKPDWVSIEIGVNDVWRQMDSPVVYDLHVSLDQYRENLDKILSQTVGKVKGVILMTPFYMDRNREDQMRAMLDGYGDVCREMAKKYGTYFVDLQAVFDEYLKYRHSSFMTWDRVHPDEVASLLIARAFFEAAGMKLSLEI